LKRKKPIKNNIMRKIVKIAILCLLLHFGVYASSSSAAVRLKMMVVNPSDTEKKVIPVKQYLPKEISREDITDLGGMQIEYDPKEGAYYVYKDVELEAKASMTIQIVISDKWEVPPEKIEEVKKKISEKLKTLENTEQYATAKLLADKIQAKVDAIQASQGQAAADMDKKMELSRVNREELDRLENDIHSLEYLTGVAQARDEAGTIKYRIEAENPGDTVMETRITHYLPKEIQSENVVQLDGFNTGYDKDKQQLYLWKDEKFAPKERKKYEIGIKDIWNLPDKVLDEYKNDAELLVDKLSDTKYKELSSIIFNDLINEITIIKTSQGEVSTFKDRIALYPANAEREKNVRKSLERLKAMLGDIAKNVSLQQRSESTVHNVLRQIKSLEQLKIMSETLVKKFMPKTEVWRVIMDIVIFTIIMTLIVTIIWAIRLNKEDSVKLKKVEKQENEKVG